MTCGWSGCRGRMRSSSMESSGVVLEGDLRFGSTMASPVSQGVDGAAGFGWRSFNEVTLVWIDVELTGAACSWLGDRVGMAGRIGIGLIGCRRQVRLCCGALDLWWTVVVSAQQMQNNVWVAFPDLGRSWFDSSCVSVPMVVVGLNVFPFVLPLHLQLCVFYYCYCLLLLLWFKSRGWFVCYLPAVNSDQLVWVGANGGGSVAVMVVVFLVNGSKCAGWRGLDTPNHSLLLSASYIFNHYFLIFLFCCISFPSSACPRGHMLSGFSPDRCTQRVSSDLERWRIGRVNSLERESPASL